MANFYGSARSNYVLWDADKLEALRRLFGFTVAHRTNRATCAILADEEQTLCYVDPHDDSLRDPLQVLGLVYEEWADSYIEFLEVVHLAFAPDSSLFVWMSIGSEKMRYLHGCALTIDLTGEIVNQINLHDIYETEGVTSRAEY